MSDLIPFTYKDTPVRTVLIDGEPWFVLSDLCKVLGLGTPAKVATRLADDMKGVTQIHTPGGRQEMISTHSESDMRRIASPTSALTLVGKHNAQRYSTVTGMSRSPRRYRPSVTYSTPDSRDSWAMDFPAYAASPRITDPSVALNKSALSSMRLIVPSGSPMTPCGYETC